MENLKDKVLACWDSDAASGKIFRISKCFHRSKQDLKEYFSKQ